MTPPSRYTTAIRDAGRGGRRHEGEELTSELYAYGDAVGDETLKIAQQCIDAAIDKTMPNPDPIKNVTAKNATAKRTLPAGGPRPYKLLLRTRAALRRRCPAPSPTYPAGCTLTVTRFQVINGVLTAVGTVTGWSVGRLYVPLLGVA